MGKGESKRKRQVSDQPAESAKEHQASDGQPAQQSTVIVGVEPLEERDTSQAAEQSQEKRHWWEQPPPISRDWLAIAEVGFAFAIVILTVGLFIATAWQTWAMVEQNKIMRDQMEQGVQAARESAADAARTAKAAKADSQRVQMLLGDASEKLLRAYVSVKPDEVVDAKQPDKLKVTVVIGNSGITRAHDVKLTMGTMIAPQDINDAFNRDEQSPIRSWLAPKDETSQGRLIDVTPSQRESMKAGKDVLWIYGIVTYKDEYGQDRCTQYRYYYDWKEETFGVAPEGNEADKCFPDEPPPAPEPPIRSAPPAPEPPRA
jgi:hypothetical protein